MKILKIILFSFFGLILFLYFFGISISKNNTNKINNYLKNENLNIVFSKIKIKLPNIIEIKSIDLKLLDKNKSETRIKTKKLKIKLSLKNVIKFRKKLYLEIQNYKNIPKFLDEVEINDISVYSKIKINENKNKISEIILDKIFNEINSLPKIPEINIKKVNYFDNIKSFNQYNNSKIFNFIEKLKSPKKQINTNKIFIKNFSMKELKNKKSKTKKINVKFIFENFKLSIIVYNKDISINIKDKNFLKIKEKFKYKNIENILNLVLKMNNRNLRIKNFYGDINPKLQINFNLSNILFNKNKTLLIEGTFKSNINSDINRSGKNINFKNINFEILFKDNKYFLKNGKGFINKSVINFSILSNKILDLPNKINFKIANFDIKNLLLNSKKQNENISIPISFKLNLIKNNNKYSGKINLEPIEIKINEMGIKTQSFIIDIDKNNAYIKNLKIFLDKTEGFLNFNGFFSLESKKNKVDIFSSKNFNLNFNNFFNIKDSKNIFLKSLAIDFSKLKLNNVNFNFYNVSSSDLFLYFKTDFLYKKDKKYFFSIENNNKKINMFDIKLTNEKDIDFFYLLLNLNADYIKILDFYTFGNKNNKIVCSGAIPLLKNKNFEFSLFAKKYVFNSLKYIQKDILTDFAFYFKKEKSEDLKLKNDIHIYGKDFNLKVKTKYENENLNVEEITFNNQTKIFGNYNFDNDEYNLTMNIEKFPITKSLYFLKNFFNFKIIENKIFKDLHIANNLFFLKGRVNIKKNTDSFFNNTRLTIYDTNNTNKILINLESVKNIYEVILFQKNLKKGFFKLDINNLYKNTSQDSKINSKFLKKITIKGFLKNFILNDKNINLNFGNTIFQDLKNKNSHGNLILKNIKINDIKFDKFNLSYEFYDRKLNIKNFYLDNNVFGFMTINKNNFLNGEIILNNLNIVDLINKNLNKSKNLNKYLNFLNCSGKIFINGNIKNPKIFSKDFVFVTNKGKTSFGVKTDIEYENKNFYLKNGNLFINDSLKSKFDLDFKNISNFIFNMKLINLDTKNLESFLPRDIIHGIINGNISIKRETENFINVNTLLMLNNGCILTMDAEKLESSIVYNLKEKSIDIKKFKIIEKIINKNIFLEIKENSKIFLTNDKNAILDLKIYMKNWNLLGVANGLGDINLFCQINKDSVFGQVEFLQFWVTNMIFRDKILKFSLKNNLLEIKSPNVNNGITGEVFFDKGNIFLKEIVYKDVAKKKSISVSGKILKNDDINVSIVTKKIDAGILTRLFNIGFYISGDADVNAYVRNNLLDPIISLECNVEKGKFDILKFEKLYGNIEITKNSININDISISSKNKYSLVAFGKIPYPLLDSEEKFVKNQKMNVRIQSNNTNLGILEELFGDIIVKPKGNFQIDMNVGNSLDDMVLNGKISVTNGSLGLKDGVKNIFDLNSEIRVINNLAKINKFEGRVGKGRFLLLGNTLLKDLNFKYFDLDFKIPSKKGIQLELNSLKIPQQSIIKLIPSVPSKIGIKGNISIKGDIENYLVKGDVVLNDTNFTYPPQTKNSSDILDDPILRGMNLDLNLKTESNVWFENKFINLAIDGNTNLKGPINNIIVNGDVKFLRGEINYIGIYFKINEGEFSLVNNEPFVALKGETEIERYDDTFNRNVEDTIKLTIEKSPLQDIKFKFESQNYPSTSPKEAMNLAISGGSMEGQSGAEKEQYMKREFYKLIDNTLTTPIVKMLLQSTGVVDFVKVNTNIAEKTLNSQPTNSLSYNTNKNTNFLAGSSFTVGKYLNPNLFVSYAMTLEENTKNSTLNTEKTELVLQHEIEAKLKLKQNLYLKGVMELDSEKSESRDRQVKLEYSFPFLSGKKNNTNKKNTSKEIA